MPLLRNWPILSTPNNPDTPSMAMFIHPRKVPCTKSPIWLIDWDIDDYRRFCWNVGDCSVQGVRLDSEFAVRRYLRLDTFVKVAKEVLEYLRWTVKRLVAICKVYHKIVGLLVTPNGCLMTTVDIPLHCLMKRLE